MSTRSALMDKIIALALLGVRAPSQLAIDKALAFVQVVPSFAMEGIETIPAFDGGIDLSYEKDRDSWFSLHIQNDGIFKLEVSDGTKDCNASMLNVMKAFYEYTRGQDNG